MNKIEKKEKYSIEQIARFLQVEVSEIRTWRDMGVFNKDQSRAYQLRSQKDKNIILGKDLLEFLAAVEIDTIQTKN